MAGVDVERLFEPPGAEEREAVRTDWRGRAPGAAAVRIEADAMRAFGGETARVRVVSHRVDGNAHYGAVVTPAGGEPASLPVLVYAHGGASGVDVEEGSLLAAALGLGPSEVIHVIPSFRGEPLRMAGTAWLSEGAPSPWDRDVDDALALVEAVLELVPVADPERIGAVGVSRGGTVALLAAVRDPRIRAVTSFAAPTDFFGPFVRDLVVRSLEGEAPDLPGMDVLDAELIQPLRLGELSVEEARLELVRRSPAAFAGDLPAVQLHHGTDDDVVPVGETERLREVLVGLGRGEPELEVHLYPGAGHHPLGMLASAPRTASFIRRNLSAPAAVSQRGDR